LKLSRGKRFAFYLGSFLIGVILSLLVAEIGARMFGLRPWQVKQAEIAVEPGGRFYIPHPALGYTHLPGQFKVTLGGSYTFKATNLGDTLRITQPLNSYRPGDKRRGIWILGDSVTYGWSVNDEETYPWLLQERFPDYKVVNFGVNGYGTLHSLIQLREALKSESKPRLVILTYASWHDARNTFIRFRRKMLAPTAHLGPINQPYAALAGDGKLNIFMDTIEYREFPLMRYSAFINALEEAYDRYEERHARSHEITEAIIKEISDLCRANGIEFVVASLTSDTVTSDTFEYCQREGIRTASVWVDFINIRGNNNLPFDSHPSAVAHQQYAQKLESFLRSAVLH
jgi:hypothetical protein